MPLFNNKRTLIASSFINRPVSKILQDLEAVGQKKMFWKEQSFQNIAPL
jgi:hypothetical protein